MVAEVRGSNAHVIRLLAWVVMLAFLAGSSPASAAKKPTLPPRIGFGARQLYPELAADLGLTEGVRGFVILWVMRGSPAEAAGVKSGDVLVKIQRNKAKPVEVSDEARYQAALKGLRDDQDVTLFVLRGGVETPIKLRPSTGEFGAPVQPAPNPEPATIKAAPDGVRDTRTLVGALLRAKPGDAVLVAGKQLSSPVWLDNLTLASPDREAPAEVGGLEVAQAKGVKVANLAFTAPAGPSQGQAGISVYGAADVVVANCRIQGFTDGVLVESSEGVVLEGNTISQNVAGIRVQASTVRLTRNLVLRNAREPKGWAYFFGGISVVGGSAEITQNTVLENQVPPERFRALLPQLGGVGVGIWLADTTAVVANNLVLNNNIGVMVGAKAQATVEYNDAFNHVIQGGVWTVGNNEYHLQGAGANFLTQISYEYKPQPIFPIINFNPDRHFYTPVLQFQPSQTNLTVDPLFADRLKGDYRLALDSPLIGRGRGGTYIGAFPPVVTLPPTSPVRGAATDATVSLASSATPSSSAHSPTDVSPSPKQVTQGSGFRAWVQGNALFVQAEAVDAVWGRLYKRLTENPQSLERVKSGSVGVLPFAFTGAEGIAPSPSLSEDLTTAMINSGLSPADPGLVKKALADLAVKDSGELDQNLSRELGRKANCRFLLVGSVSDRGPVVVVTMRLMEAETGQYLAAERLEVARPAN